MTLTEIKALSDDEEIRVKVAELEGKRATSQWDAGYITWYDQDSKPVPDYPHDLNAVHEIIGKLSKTKLSTYGHILREVTGTRYPINATARQRCEALLMTLKGTE